MTAMNAAPKRNGARTLAIMATYTALCALFFAVRYSECYRSLRWVVALPAAFAALAASMSSRRGGAWIPLALAASAAGDAMGALNIFFGQVGFFAAAHIFFIMDFARRMNPSLRRLSAIAALALPTACYAGFIIMRTQSTAVSTAVGTYAAIILCMAASAILQIRRNYPWYVAAALLFVLSDGMIAYGIGGGRIPHSTVWIMTAYYAAQGIFAWLHMARLTPRD